MMIVARVEIPSLPPTPRKSLRSTAHLREERGLLRAHTRDDYFENHYAMMTSRSAHPLRGHLRHCARRATGCPNTNRHETESHCRETGFAFGSRRVRDAREGEARPCESSCTTKRGRGGGIDKEQRKAIRAGGSCSQRHTAADWHGAPGSEVACRASTRTSRARKSSASAAHGGPRTTLLLRLKREEDRGAAAQ
ncbi:unnamed protein product [Prorocentrum cordatum]|uniref:Uncharacterized protein n=1 Tax=Prorocentrum cordatum TaxID=2364126 RepID=A0ABN9SUU6_9DINO|nr:unnamed protein product [Polarella glacialis]